ncbi:hypothetical protein SAMN06265222_10857 [Neorhodopirellula lusitana]|uniref:Uncharacterized protein n=1 Tax=Neorhodopirellula lusitana TaxID=445327 RepID=A0ABY1Q8Q2_9BACT|nr:hypothetical protein SAMN06265222_10857 [Neorhodopirellula lusitana]
MWVKLPVNKITLLFELVAERPGLSIMVQRELDWVS